MAKLEQHWPDVADSLRLSVRLLADFGFSGRTLTADSVVIPISYYLYRRKANESYLHSDSFQPDRECVRSWVIRSLLKAGVWGSGLDTLLLALRQAFQENDPSHFPSEALESAMNRLGKSLRFEGDELDDLLAMSYGDKRTFPLLSILYPGMDFRNEFHVDHIFPKSLFGKRKLAESGIPHHEIEELRYLCDRLPNLQLLEGPVNVAKQAKAPTDWIHQHFPDQFAADAYAARHDLGELPNQIQEFKDFHDARRARMVKRLRTILGMASA